MTTPYDALSCGGKWQPIVNGEGMWHYQGIVVKGDPRSPEWTEPLVPLLFRYRIRAWWYARGVYRWGR